MTHIVMLVEGLRPGIEEFITDIERGAVYTQRNGAAYEIGKKATVKVRELRLFDIVVKDDVKDQLLRDLKTVATASVAEEEKPRKEKGNPDSKAYLTHGFKIGLFRRLAQQVMKMVGLKPINMHDVTPTPVETNPIIQSRKERQKSWHCHAMVLGELPDPITKTPGRNQGRENT